MVDGSAVNTYLTVFVPYVGTSCVVYAVRDYPSVAALYVGSSYVDLAQ